jgi:hypothetical protein
MTRKRNHRAKQKYTNTWADKRGYTSELYSLTEVQKKFSTEIFEALDDDHTSRNM